MESTVRICYKSTDVILFVQLVLVTCLILVSVPAKIGKRPGDLYSVMFSPVEPNVVAVATEDEGAIIYDIRNLKRYFSRYSVWVIAL